ncbi:MAG TPA: TetR family transcriptional regulator [Candidatus Baltobacteraceae bacterium]
MIFRQAAATAPKGGRVAQKERTRAELLRAARELRASGRVPTVSDVADAANISRTTAYRYFPTQEMLLAEAAAEPLVQAVADAITGAGGNGDVLERVDAVFAELAPLMLRHEPELRALLKIALERSLAEVHQRKIPLLSGAWVRAWDPILEPLRGEVSPVTYALMVRSLGTLLAVETLNVLRDACDMDDAAATAAIRAAARAMTRGFLLDSTRRKPQ